MRRRGQRAAGPLYQLGYELYGGGEYDLHTEAAVRRFQADCGLEATGVADDDTLAHVAQYCESPPAEADGRVPVRGSRDRWPVPTGRRAGQVLATGEAKPVSLENGMLGELSDEARQVLEMTLLSSPYSAPFVLAIELANAYGWTVGVGLDVDFVAQIEPLGLGITAGGGLYFSPGNQWGLYGTAGVNGGWVETASGGVCMAAVIGGPSDFGGDFLALEGSIGEVFGAGVALLFNPNTFQFAGFAGSAVVCGGNPVGVFASYTRTWLKPL